MEGESLAVLITHDGSAPATEVAGRGSSWLQRYHVGGDSSQPLEVAEKHTSREFRV
jgi:hypothetical protein